MNNCDKERAIEWAKKWMPEGHSVSFARDRLSVLLGYKISFDEARVVIAEADCEPVSLDTETTAEDLASEVKTPGYYRRKVHRRRFATVKCAACGANFHPKTKAQTICRACKEAQARARLKPYDYAKYDCVCDKCGRPFKGLTPKQKCCRNCNGLSRLGARKWLYKRYQELRKETKPSQFDPIYTLPNYAMYANFEDAVQNSGVPRPMIKRSLDGGVFVRGVRFERYQL